MFTFLLFLAVLVLFIQISNLRGRITELEQREASARFDKRSDHTPVPATPPTAQPATMPDLIREPAHPVSPPATATTTIPAPTSYAPEVHTEPQPVFLVEWFKEQTLIKVGALIFFLGIVWFLSYAFEHNWIPPLARIVLGLLIAIGIAAVGALRRESQVTQYQVLTVLGVATWFGTVVASQFAFGSPLLSPMFALILLVLSISYLLAVAVSTKTEWLAVVAAIAGIAAPWFVNQPDANAFGLLLYLLVLSAGLLLVVFVTRWRLVTLVLLAGVAVQQLLVHMSGEIADGVLWVFIVLHSVLFFAAASVTLLRTNAVRPVDVTIFGILAVQFWYFADATDLLPAVAMFSAALASAVVGYAARMRAASVDVVSVFAAISAAGVFVGTSYLFDGYSLTIAYALEALLVTVLTTRVAIAPRSILVATATFVLPLSTGFLDLANPVWRDGVLHPQALGVTTVVVALGIAVLYLGNKAIVHGTLDWLKGLAGAIAVAWYGFTLLTLGVVSQALADTATMTAVWLTFLSVALFAVVSGIAFTFVPWQSWRILAAVSGLVPVYVAVYLMMTASVTGAVLFATSTVAVVLIGITTCLWLMRHRFAGGESIAYGLLWMLLLYAAPWIWNVWDAYLPASFVLVATYVSYAFVLYAVANVLLQLRTSFAMVGPIIIALSCPAILSLGSVDLGGWSDGIVSVDAMGIYVVTTIILLLATTLRQYTPAEPDEAEAVRLGMYTLFSVGAAYMIATVWMVTHTVASTAAVAVTIALLVYTISGLVAYLYGRASDSAAWRRVGVILLVGVVARLGLVDVWEMELLWRIVTFMAVGAMFIVAALIESSAKRSDDQSQS